jgi:hypothetical protein
MRNGRVFVDSFSSPVSELRGRYRTPEKVLECLKKEPRVSTFDLSENKWLLKIIRDLKSVEAIREVESAYPWHKFAVVKHG